MASTKNNLNVDIFCALKASEVSKVPVLLLGNPGLGKTVSVYKFCEIRGYRLTLLRGNSSTPEEIMGYDVAPKDVTYDKPMSAIHLRPSWFEEILRNHEAGQPTLLFLDEITTANEFVQSALLHLIFERKVGNEPLPDDTLIVSAGNYGGNLSNTMALIPPVMNRFMIYNCTADHSDLDIFLNKFEGAIADVDGKCNNYMAELSKTLSKMDAQERKVSEGMRNKIGEYIEKSIKDTARMLITTTKEVDLSVTDLKNIYSDADEDSKLCGFVSFRTLNYLRDVTVAWYLCFGKQGISSKNYRNAVDGLCGIGVTRPKGSSDVKIAHIGKAFYDAMVQTANELEKLNNDRLPEYTKFFMDMVKSKTELTNEEINAITNKVEELNKDPELENIDRPIDSTLISTILDLCKKSVTKNCKVKVSVSDKLTEKIPVGDLAAMIVHFNYTVDFINKISEVTTDSKRHYNSDVADIIEDATTYIRNIGFRLRSVRKIIGAESEGIASTIPNPKILGK